MIAQIRGEVIEITEKGLVLDTGPIGYMVYTPAAYAIGDTITLHTELIIRDDAHELYGFATREERLLFATLITVSGVGPKTALQMLSMYPLPDLVRAIRDGDSKAVALVPGIGKKTAEKVIIDLKDKLAAFATAEQGVASDLVEALLSLGFKEYDIRLVATSVSPDLTLEQQITAALQLLKK